MVMNEKEDSEKRRMQNQNANYSYPDSMTEEAVQVYKTEHENHVETGDSVKKEKRIEEASAVKKTEENVNFEYISNAGASRMELISKTSLQKLVDVNKLDLEEKLELEDAKENMEAEMQKKEEVSDIHLDDIPVKSR